MVQLLCVPDRIRTDCGYVISGRTAFCILLYRMAFPCRYVDMRMLFHLPDSLLCEAFNYMLHFMNDTWGRLLTLDVGRLVPQLEYFANVLQTWGCPLPFCWAFIDGTVRGICRWVFRASTGRSLERDTAAGWVELREGSTRLVWSGYSDSFYWHYCAETEEHEVSLFCFVYSPVHLYYSKQVVTYVHLCVVLRRRLFPCLSDRYGSNEPITTGTSENTPSSSKASSLQMVSWWTFLGQKWALGMTCTC